MFNRIENKKNSLSFPFFLSLQQKFVNPQKNDIMEKKLNF